MIELFFVSLEHDQAYVSIHNEVIHCIETIDSIVMGAIDTNYLHNIYKYIRFNLLIPSIDPSFDTSM